MLRSYENKSNKRYDLIKAEAAFHAGGGGSWRAFVSTHDVGLFRDFAKLSTDYAEMKMNDPAGTARMQSLGRR